MKKLRKICHYCGLLSALASVLGFCFSHKTLDLSARMRNTDRNDKFALWRALSWALNLRRRQTTRRTVTQSFFNPVFFVFFNDHTDTENIKSFLENNLKMSIEYLQFFNISASYWLSEFWLKPINSFMESTVILQKYFRIITGSQPI